MKHIQISVKSIGPKFDTVAVTILKQTHKGFDFGCCGDSFSHCGLTLKSVDCPENSKWDTNVVYMQGRQCWKDGNTIILPLAKYTKFVAAVEAYNKQFAAKPAVAKASNCTYIIG